MKNLIISTTDYIPDRKIVKILGVVKGNTIRARWVGRDIMAAIKNLVGGEIVSYTQMLTEAREEAQSRMIKEAEKLGADAVINVKFTSSQVMDGTAEILAYGTAVKIK